MSSQGRSSQPAREELSQFDSRQGASGFVRDSAAFFDRAGSNHPSGRPVLKPRTLLARIKSANKAQTKLSIGFQAMHVRRQVTSQRSFNRPLSKLAAPTSYSGLATVDESLDFFCDFWTFAVEQVEASSTDGVFYRLAADTSTRYGLQEIPQIEHDRVLNDSTASMMKDLIGGEAIGPIFVPPFARQYPYFSEILYSLKIQDPTPSGYVMESLVIRPVNHNLDVYRSLDIDSTRSLIPNFAMRPPPFDVGIIPSEDHCLPLINHYVYHDHRGNESWCTKDGCTKSFYVQEDVNRILGTYVPIYVRSEYHKDLEFKIYRFDRLDCRPGLYLIIDGPECASYVLDRRIVPLPKLFGVFVTDTSVQPYRHVELMFIDA